MRPGPLPMPPSGEQIEIAAGGYRAVVTESGAALRLLEHHHRPLVDGFAADQTASGGRGQLLMPWPNRIRDGRYSFGGRDLQLALSEPKRSNASHGLARWAAWTVLDRTDAAATLGLRVMAQSGYPWLLDLTASYAVTEDGLTVTQTARNLGDEPAPYACGAHPYLTLDEGPVDRWELTYAARRRLLTDDRMLPTGDEPVAGGAYDFSASRLIGPTSFDDAFEVAGPARVTIRDPETREGVQLWGDESVRWLQLYSADDAPVAPRRSLAVEPMTAPADAFNSGTDLVTLAPGGEHAMTWGIRALEA